MVKEKFIKTDIQGGKYHLLDLKESIDNAVDEFHRLIPVDNDSDLQDLWNRVAKDCCKKFIEDNEEDNEQNLYWKNFDNINAERNKDKSKNK